MVATVAEYDRVPRILRLNVAGQPTDWITWQEAVCLYAREVVVWALGYFPAGKDRRVAVDQRNRLIIEVQGFSQREEFDRILPGAAQVDQRLF